MFAQLFQKMKQYFSKLTGRNKRWVGLDIQSNGIYCVELIKKRKSWCLERVMIWSLSEMIFAEGKIKQWQILEETLFQVVHEFELSDCDVAIAIPAHLARLQQIILPKSFSDVEIEAEIYAHLSRDLAGMNEPLCIDFNKNVITHDEHQMSVDFAVARKEYISQYISTLQATGLNVTSIEVECYALLRALIASFNTSPATAEILGMIYIKNDITTVILFDHSRILFHQQWPTLETLHLSEQIKRSIQLFVINAYSTFASVPKALAHASDSSVSILKKIALCGNNEICYTIMQDWLDMFDWRLYSPLLLANMTYAPTVDKTFLFAHRYSFMTALGLAMRGMMHDRI